MCGESSFGQEFVGLALLFVSLDVALGDSVWECSIYLC